MRSSSLSASLTFTALSSASEDPQRVVVAEAGVQPQAPGVRPAGPRPGASTVITASSSADGLTGFVSSAATASVRRSRVPTDDRTRTGIGAGRRRG